MSKNNIIYFELNEWSSKYHPNVEPFISWICMSKDKNYYINFRDEQWVKDNELVIVESLVDMSINFCVSAKREWVEQNCSELLTKYKEFIRVEDEDGDVPYGNFGCPFLEWSEINIGIHQAIEKEDSQGYVYYSIDE